MIRVSKFFFMLKATTILGEENVWWGKLNIYSGELNVRFDF
jgi:hypothetical protein